MDLCALGKSWLILTLDSVSPGFHLVATSAAHTHSLRIHAHRQTTTTLHAKTTQEVAGVQKVRA